MTPIEAEMTVKLHKQVMQVLTNQAELAGILLIMSSSLSRSLGDEVHEKVSRLLKATSAAL
jgi:hypothetical protein